MKKYDISKYYLDHLHCHLNTKFFNLNYDNEPRARQPASAVRLCRNLYSDHYNLTFGFYSFLLPPPVSFPCGLPALSKAVFGFPLLFRYNTTGLELTYSPGALIVFVS